MAIITISREFGSDGTLIGQKVAERLQCPLLNKDLIERVLKEYGLLNAGKVDESEYKAFARFDKNKLDLISMLNQTILTFASLRHGVILGRAGFLVLRNYGDVLHVFIRTSLNKRVASVMKTMEIHDKSTAETLVDQEDLARDHFLQSFYGVKGNEMDYFNLVMDTGTIPADLAVNWIVEAGKTLGESQVSGKAHTSDIKADPVLLRVLNEVIAQKSR